MDFSLDELQDSAFSFFKEAKSALGIDLDSIVMKNGIEIQYVGESIDVHFSLYAHLPQQSTALAEGFRLMARARP